MRGRRKWALAKHRTQTWVQILTLSLTHCGTQQTTEFQPYSKDEESNTSRTGWGLHYPLCSAAHEWWPLYLSLSLQSTPRSTGAESLFPFSRCKTTSTLNGIGEGCVPRMHLLLPYQSIKGKEQLEPLWSISWMSLNRVGFFLCIFFLCLV